MSDKCCCNNFKFIKPVDGDMLNNQSGKLCGQSLEITVKLAAEKGRNILINGTAAIYSAGEYSAKVRLDGYRNTIEAIDTMSGDKIKMGIYWLREAAGKYRISIDDNIWFLQDIAKNSHKYASIFENPFLGLFKSVHDKYGTKVHVNVYMECPEFGGFDLTQMPDRYKAEWKENSSWLRLAFHARKNFPDKPYVETDYDTMITDYDEIIKEIIRFAGPEVLGPVTTVHWGESTVEGVRALRARGIKALMGYLTFDEKDERLVSYYLDRDQINNANYYGFWKDHSEDMIFGKIDIVLNAYTADAVPKLLDEAKKKYPEKGFMEFLIHEQYFYPHYEKYLSDYADIVFAAAQWAEVNGYKPAFVSEVVFE